jgi:hypothetical protein
MRKLAVGHPQTPGRKYPAPLCTQNDGLGHLGANPVLFQFHYYCSALLAQPCNSNKYTQGETNNSK